MHMSVAPVSHRLPAGRLVDDESVRDGLVELSPPSDLNVEVVPTASRGG
jgi:hypothetical protein